MLCWHCDLLHLRLLFYVNLASGVKNEAESTSEFSVRSVSRVNVLP